MKVSKEPILIRLRDDQMPKVDAIAEADGISRAEVIRHGVDKEIQTYDFERDK